MAAESNSSGTLIEGVGDDLIAALVALTMFIAPIAYLFWRWSRVEDSAVHAESEDLAGDVREQMRTDRDQLSASPSASSTDPTAAPSNYARLRTQTDVRCPVCIDDAKFCVQTNCGHIFCGQCFVSWWTHGRWTGAAKCPVCRQQVTVLLQCFSEEERRSSTPHKQELLRQINMYNRRFSGQPLSWLEYLRDLPTILRHCVYDFFSLGGLMWMFRLRILVCFLIAVLYLISPLDIIPEAVFGFFGLLDDFFIVVLLAIYISIIYRRFIVVRAEDYSAN